LHQPSVSTASAAWPAGAPSYGRKRLAPETELQGEAASGAWGPKRRRQNGSMGQ